MQESGTDRRMVRELSIMLPYTTFKSKNGCVETDRRQRMITRGHVWFTDEFL